MKRVHLVCAALLLTSHLSADIQSYLERNPFPGVILITKKGDVRFSQADPHVAFQIGSVSKVLISVAILRLQEQGRLTITQPVTTYLDLPNYSQVTVENLLDHTSGIPDYVNEPIDIGHLRKFATEHHSLRDISLLFTQRALHFVPGSEYRYSNSNYILLGMVIESITGRTYQEVLNDEILAVCGMNETGICAYPGSVATAEPSSTADPETALVDLSFLAAAGGVISTASDLTRFAQALMHGILITPADFENMTTPRKGGYGLGWASYQGRVLAGGHTGQTFGFSSYFFLDKGSETIVILLSNSIEQRTGEIGDNLVQIASRL